MKIYLLVRTDDVDYDEEAGLVVIAENPAGARKEAFHHHSFSDPEKSTCRCIGTALPEAKPDVVLVDFRAG